MEDSPDISRAMRMTEPSGQPSAVKDPDLIREVSDWLIREGRFAADNADLFARFCERLLALGVPLDRAYLHLRALHPQYRGVSRIWKPGEPLAERFIDYAIEKTATYIDTWDLLADAHGRYASYLRMNGKLTLMRLPDGVHYTEAAGDLISAQLLKQLRPVYLLRF